MPDYCVLGGCLRSSLEFPELSLDRSSFPSWKLETVEAEAPVLPVEVLGSDPVRGEFSVELFRTGEGYRLVYADTGTYDIVNQGSLIRWYPPPVLERPWPPNRFEEAVRIDVLGRVLATALHAQGLLCLHGSAVRIGEHAIGFLAPRFHGKSTLAYALVAAGAGLITDDTLPVEVGEPARARPGVHSIRMWEDSANRLVPGDAEFDMGAFGKLQSRSLPEDRLVHDATPLAALYLLAPVLDEPGLPAMQHESLSSPAAALSLVQHAKIGPLLGKSEAARVLDWAADLSRAVPVEVLRVIRDFSRLDEVVEELLRIHAG